MKSKGISPLIAAVLLIAFVMATAGIVSNWFVTFSKEQSRKATTRGEEEITCSYSGLEIREATYNSTSKNVSLEVENTGSESLSKFKVQVIYDNDTTSSHKADKYNTTLKEGQIEIFKNEGSISSNIDRLSIYSKDCPVRSRTWLEKKYIKQIQ